MADTYTNDHPRGQNDSFLDVDISEDVEQGGITNFDIYMGVWLPGVIAILGILGNSLSLLVLSRDTSRSTTFASLKALASSDIILLVGALAQQVVPMFCKVTGSTDTFCLNQGYIRVYSWPIICIAQMLSIWLVLLISAERFVAICYPLRASRMCSLNRIRFLILLILMMSILFNIPKFFEFRPKEIYQQSLNLTFVEVGATPLRTDPVYRYLYNTALYCLVIYAVPLSTLTVFNVKLVKEIQKAKKNWQLLNRSQKREMKATKLPLVIVLVYFICGTQSLLAFILDAIFVTFYRWLQFYTAIVNLLVILNSAVNFLLMYFFGQKFRKLLLEMLLCKKHKLTSPSTREGYV